MAPTTPRVQTPAAVGGFNPLVDSLVRVEGTLASGDLFSFDVALFHGESEYVLVDRTLLAFEVYMLDVAEYKINI